MSVEVFRSLGRHIAELRRRARTRVELQKLSDRQLADIGIHRSEIPRVSIYGRHR